MRVIHRCMGGSIPGSGEHTHQLLVRLERLPSFELEIKFRDLIEVGRERCKMEWIIPLPGRRALIVVMQHPA